ncbi:hypothetical protein DFH09DRAFT_139775 [Mycena vulgaris]|nr:hypothetical protein DFH09DRAFT_139775 [Mycena vulgaris]
MVLKVLAAAAPYFPSEYTAHIVAAIILVLTARAISQGSKTTRERDLHARVILITGAFSPIGLTLLESLAQRGAHIIALTPYPVDSEQVTTYIELLRSTTSNEQIYAEQCDLTSPTSIHAFCTRFMSGQEQRLDALLFTHEYRHIGALPFLSRIPQRDLEEKTRERASLATFLLTTLLLPALLTAPAERDIRIVNVVNRFYAAAAALPPPFVPPPAASLFLREGTRALRTTVLTRHLQRVLDALPAPPVPKSDGAAVVPPAAQKSNIVAVTVSSGISRAESVASLLNADWVAPDFSPLGILLYFLLYPVLLIFTKSAGASIQSILHILFLPTPFKAAEGAGELLKPGALYAECAVVKVRVTGAPKADGDAGEKGKGETGETGEPLEELPDDGELGGEGAGRVVWETYEAGLKAWEAAHPAPPPETAPTAPPTIAGEKEKERPTS